MSAADDRLAVRTPSGYRDPDHPEREPRYSHYYCQFLKETPRWYFDLYPNGDLDGKARFPGHPRAGWTLYVSRSKACYTLPEGTVLSANGVYKIGARATEKPVSLQLDVKRLWHKSRYDQLMLYDATGALAAVTDNGMPE